MGRWYHEASGETKIAVDGSPLDKMLAGRNGWEAVDEAAKTLSDEIPDKPAKSASKDAWLAWATHPNGGGLSADVADGLTRDQLAEQFA